MYTDRAMDKEDMLPTYNETLLSSKKKKKNEITPLQRLSHGVKLEKRQISYKITCMLYVEF